jgi:hypothetical protein
VTDEKNCAWCRAKGSRYAQFPFGWMRACDDCVKAHGGWRRDDGKPLSKLFPPTED